MKKRTLILFLIAITLISLTACRSAESAGQQGATEQPEKTALTAQQARDIALADAGLTTATFERTEYDTDDGVPEYEIEFHADGWEYDYEIHAETGKILSSDKEKELTPPPSEPAPTEDTSVKPTEPTPAEPTQSAESKKLSAEEAENIALNHAGVKRSDARFDRTEFDKDDGVTEYEIEFHADGWEYDYEIHAETGDIRSSNKEKEHDRSTAVTEPVQSAESKRLTAEEAENIALNHAGVKRSDARFDRTEFDKDDGVPEYEIEFRVGRWEYSYEIHAENGKILSSEKELDD